MSFNRFFTRSAGLSLAVVLLGGFAQESHASSKMRSAEGATLVAGDVAPSRLFVRESFGGISGGRVSVSYPASPRQPLAEPPGPETRRSKSTMLHVAPGSGPTQLSLSVTAPEEAWVMLIPKGTDAKVGEESLRDVQLFDPRGRRVDPRAARAGNAMLGTDEARMKAEGITRPVSMLRLDKEMGKGLYKVQVGRRAAAVGLAVEIREPASSVELALTASAMQLFPEDEGYVTVGLQSAEPVRSVRYEAALYNPRFEKVRTVPVVKVGSEHRAMVSRVMSEKDEPGAWVVEVRATGKAGGLAFDRLGHTAFGFAVPTARIASVGRERLVRDASGQVEALEVDVTLESQALDRYEVTGLLAATDAKGVERAVAEAQVTDEFDVGSHTLTLRFEAGHAGLSKLDGSYALRGLRLYSLGTNALYHRLGKGLEVRFPAVSLSELKAATVTPAIENLLREGEFDVAE